MMMVLENETDCTDTWLVGSPSIGVSLSRCRELV